MKKVGIMTWFHHSNYGTILQATALSHSIKKLGYNVELVNYIPDGKMVKNVEVNYLYIKSIVGKKIKNRLNDFYNPIGKEKKCKDFTNEHLSLSERCQTSSMLFDLNDKYDAFVCGSDQIWTPLHFDAKYFLDFAKTNKIISYAPSIGVNSITNQDVQNQMAELINRFSHLSVREKKGQKIIKDLTGKSAKVVLDPTLLLDRGQWDLIVKNDKIVDGDYIFCYFLGDNKENWKKVAELVKHEKCQVIILPIYKKDLKRGYICMEDIGPQEFMSLIKHAKHICTDSFHGAIFSIIYEKQLSVFERFKISDSNSQNSRIYNLLEFTSLEKRICTKSTPISQMLRSIDYEKVNHQLSLMRKDSLLFLENSLRTVCNNVGDKYKITNTCSGCGSCLSLCPVDAINIQYDSNGFLQSTIDEDKCIKCGLCKKSCPFNNYKDNQFSNKTKLYMVKSKNEYVLKNSSSGGLAFEISDYFLSKKYPVIGCQYNLDKNIAEHIIIKDKSDLFKLQGSKYLQSHTETIMKDALNLQKAVIFGSPCQIAGIHKVLNMKNTRENFVLIDLICHGVPTINLWNKYLSEIKKSNGIDIDNLTSVKFRNKSFGWKERVISLTDNHGNIFHDSKEKKFYNFFTMGHCKCTACYECNYRSNSYADIKIGDFWGSKFSDDTQGVSMALAITKKGERLLDELYILGNIMLSEQSIEDYKTNQDTNNSIKPIFYDSMMKEMRKDSTSLVEIYDKYERGIAKMDNLYKKLEKVKKNFR